MYGCVTSTAIVCAPADPLFAVDAEPDVNVPDPPEFAADAPPVAGDEFPELDAEEPPVFNPVPEHV